ncbi:MAG: gliding motility-associated C-terminal domain-containing protein [Bacteroidetes bacterium]|nr:gliding motility-associated C-terminal domain-containing protein [Bacteroidota bacterium]
MLKKIAFLFFVQCVLIHVVNSQPNKRTNIWYFSNYVGLNFNSSEPVEDPDGQVFSPWSEGSTSMCDTTGNLLFYCDGRVIWNKNHMWMENEFGFPDIVRANLGTIAISKPGSDSIYYVFINSLSNGTPRLPMFYYTIDMSLENGFGKVIDVDTLETAWDAAEKITAAYHNNKQDIWVVTRKFVNDNYAAYLITDNGVSTQPILSPAPDRNLNWGNTNWGSMKISYDKKYLVTTFEGDQSQSGGFVEICTFNNQTGTVTFYYDFQLQYSLPYTEPYEESSCEFSPCSKYLYVAGEIQSIPYRVHIFQFDMQHILDSIIFIQSALRVGEVQGSNLQLAPDGKIYCLGRASFSNPSNPLNNFLGVINHPEKLGLNCDYDSSVLQIENGQVTYGNVNFFNDYLHRFDFNGICESDTFTFDPWFFPEPDIIEWNFGDPASGTNNTSTIPHATHVFTDGGTYEVSVHVEYPPSPTYPFGRIEETSREVEVVFAPEPNLGPDTTICHGNEIILYAYCGQYGYSWSTGDWGVNNITVSDSGWYWVKATNSEGCFEIDSIYVSFYPSAIADTNNLVISPTTCGGSVGAIRGLAVSGNQPIQYLWVDDLGDSIANTIDIYHLPVGNYTLKVMDGNDCVAEFGPYSITDAGEVLIEDVIFSHEHCNQQNGSIIVTATSGLGDMLKYSITNGEPYFYNEGIFTGLPAGTYAVRVKDSTDCEDVFTFNPIIIENIQGPQITGIQTTPATVGQNNGSFNIIASGSGDTIYYSNDNSVSFQINDGFFINLFAGYYNCVVVDEFGCDTTFVVEVTEEVTVELEAVAGADEVCPGNSAFVPLNVSNFNDVASFKTALLYNNELLTCTGITNTHSQFEDSLKALLFPSEGKIELTWASSAVTLPENSKIAELVFQSIDPGTSFVDWDGAAGASLFLNSTGLTIPVGYTTGNVEIYHDVGFIMFGANEVCDGNMLNITPLVFSHNGDVTYLWTLPNGSTSSNESLIINNVQTNQSGVYHITVTDTADCKADTAIDVLVFPTPLPDFAVQDTIFTDDPFDLDAGSGYLHYWWNTGDTTQSIWVENNGWYSTEVQSTKGCTGTDSSFVLFSTTPQLIKMYFPNAFTPNGDGLNDKFNGVTSTIDVNQFSLSIYNRWGAMIYHTNDITNGWDGIYQGELCQPGAYVYKVSHNSSTSLNAATEVKMGTVMLIR